MRTGGLAIAWMIACVLHSVSAGPLRHKPSTPDYPSDARARFARAVIFEREGRPGDAKAEYYGSAELSPQANTYYDIAMLWLAFGSHHDCAVALKKYVELAPKAADRAEVEALITELEHRLPAVFVGAADFASSEPGMVVVLDGQVVGPAPQLVHPSDGRHVIERIGPTLYAREHRNTDVGADDAELEPHAAASTGNVTMDGLAPFESPIVDRRPYLVMEFLDGISLADAVGRMPPGLACFAACEALAALDAVHAHGVVHRDLKPANLFLARDGRVVVLDFGIAKLVDPEGAAQTHSTGLIGTPEYMAPEQIRSLPLDRRTDVYAMGIVLYETITGRRPFAAATFDMLVQHLERPPTAPREWVPELAPAIDAAIVRALAKDPAERFQSAAALAATLRAAIGPDLGRAALAEYVDARALAPPVPLETTPPSQHAERAKPEIAARDVETVYDKPARRRRWLPIAGIAVVVLSGGSAYLAARSHVHHTVTANPDAAPKVEIVTSTPVDAPIAVPAPLDAARAPATSPLRVDTDPEGADVTIDGTLAGKSPVVVTISVGMHRLAITRVGWKSYEGPVYVPANERPATRIALTRAPIAPRDRVDPPVESSQPAPVPPPTEKPNPYR